MADRGNQFPEAKVKATVEKSALKGTATVEDVADQIKTLVLSKSITGQNIVLDCGIAI
jgi:enoyl-[acyl-carrier-protein] reductase (NADH)